MLRVGWDSCLDATWRSGTGAGGRGTWRGTAAGGGGVMYRCAGGGKGGGCGTLATGSSITGTWLGFGMGLGLGCFGMALGLGLGCDDTAFLAFLRALPALTFCFFQGAFGALDLQDVPLRFLLTLPVASSWELLATSATSSSGSISSGLHFSDSTSSRYQASNPHSNSTSSESTTPLAPSWISIASVASWSSVAAVQGPQESSSFRLETELFRCCWCHLPCHRCRLPCHHWFFRPGMALSCSLQLLVAEFLTYLCISWFHHMIWSSTMNCVWLWLLSTTVVTSCYYFENDNIMTHKLSLIITWNALVNHTSRHRTQRSNRKSMSERHRLNEMIYLIIIKKRI